MGAEYLFYMKYIETHARAFLPLNKSAIGSVMEYGVASLKCWRQVSKNIAEQLLL